jgi:hypothetical protein
MGMGLRLADPGPDGNCPFAVVAGMRSTQPSMLPAPRDSPARPSIKPLRASPAPSTPTCSASCSASSMNCA